MNPDNDALFQSAHEIGKIYQSLTDRKTLSLFFLESVSKYIAAQAGFLYLIGREDRIWLDCRVPEGQDDPSFLASVEKEAAGVLREGQPVLKERLLALPLLSRNSALGAVVFVREDGEAFSRQDLDLATGLGFQMAGSLKNIILFEENVRMERLAAVGQTTGMVLHEIKNIMQLAHLSYEFMGRGLKKNDPKFIERGMKNMELALAELEGFTLDMLSLTKDYELDVQQAAFADILRQLEDQLREKAKDLKVNLVFETSPDLGPVHCDRRALYRTLLNLVKNAMEASNYDRNDSWVKVRARPLDEQRYEVVVEDNGIGMTPEVKARLFEAFFSTKGQKGTGLGLLIIERTVRKHQGKIEIESEQGKGTCFRLTFPMNPAGSS